MANIKKFFAFGFARSEHSLNGVFVFQAQLVQAAQIVYNKQTDGGGGTFLAKGKNVRVSSA